MKILLADDEKLTLKLLDRIVREDGYEPVLASDGGEAWEIMRRPDAPTLAIIDWQMPVMDGIELCKRIRELSCPISPHLIMLTARDGEDDIVKGLEAGADDYVVKPLNKKVLRARIKVGQRIVEMARNSIEHDRALVRAEKLRTLGTLVASVAHEINNPNGVVAMNAPFLAKIWREATPAIIEAARGGAIKSGGAMPPEKLAEKSADMLDAIVRSSQRINRIVQLLRDYVRGQPTEIAFEQVDMNTVVGNALEMLGAKIRGTTRRLTVKLEEGLPSIMGNSPRLGQVVVNLLANAMDALTDPDQGIEVSTGWLPDSREIRVAVRDEGAGMDEGVLSRLGEPFMSTKGENGTGLGVAISMEIVGEHGGSINYQSKPGAGTTATITIKTGSAE